MINEIAFDILIVEEMLELQFLNYSQMYLLTYHNNMKPWHAGIVNRTKLIQFQNSTQRHWQQCSDTSKFQVQKSAMKLYPR